MEVLHCDRCGKNMVSESGEKFAGMEAIIYDVSKFHPSELEFYKEQAGKYELGRRYGICYECLVDMMLGKS